MKAFLLCLGLCLSAEAFAKKDFKGLFGSYRREKFTENEGRSTDFGIDLGLSTMLPVSSIVKSSEDDTRTSPGNDLNYSIFFNYELGAFFTLNYSWEIGLKLGYYSYDTRHENLTFTQPDKPLFHLFEMQVVPALLTVKYRFSSDDIVPYIGAGGGIAYVSRRGYYDYTASGAAVTGASTVSPQNQEYLTAVTAEVNVGVEFYFAPRAGIRLETSANYLGVPSHAFDTGGTASNFPIFYYQANVITMRYASGLFFLF